MASPPEDPPAPPDDAPAPRDPSAGNANPEAEPQLPAGPALYLVATPIGNLEDVTLRALRVLRQCDRILAEDTRKTAILLQRYGIRTPMSSYRIHQRERDDAFAVEQLRADQRLAFCTDAGMPGVSDPGSHLVRRVRGELPDCPILPIPGASAVTALWSVTGWQTNPALFAGFLSNKGGPRRRFLEEQRDFPGVLTIYESVHRIEALLRDIRAVLPERAILVGREITKFYEQYVGFEPAFADEYSEAETAAIETGPGNAAREDDATRFEEFLRSIPRKGEFVVAVGPPPRGSRKRRMQDRDRVG